MKIIPLLICLGMILPSSGCQDSLVPDVVPPQGALDQVYWSLTIEYRAVNLALTSPFNTVKLTATPRNALGDIIESSESPVFTILDTDRLSVTPDGVVTAKAVGSNIRVAATLQIGSVTHTDTTLVKVTDNAPAQPLATLSVQPADSAVWSWGGDNKNIIPVALTSSDQTISNLQVAYRSSDTRIARIIQSGATNAQLQGQATGTFWLTSSTYAYGVYKVDSVEYKIGLPVRQIIDVVSELASDGVSTTVAFYPTTVIIGVGGYIQWRFFLNGWTAVTGSPAISFQDPTAPKLCPQCPAHGGISDNKDGDIPAHYGTGSFMYLGSAYRLFETPGIYVYSDHTGNVSARVIVGQETTEN